MVLGGTPHLTLHASGSRISKKELWLWVTMGVLLQCAALSEPAILMYTAGYRIRLCGYVCYIIGMIGVCIGLALSSHVIEGSTTKFEFVQNPENYIPL
jgi:hypothetical protein